jgi:hypothetical protein
MQAQQGWQNGIHPRLIRSFNVRIERVSPIITDLSAVVLAFNCKLKNRGVRFHNARRFGSDNMSKIAFNATVSYFSKLFFKPVCYKMKTRYIFF